MNTPDELHRPPEPAPPEPPPREEGTAALACTQAIELIKQFFTLSSAGVAFVVGLVFADKPVKLPTAAAKWSMILFGLSIAAGCVAYMAVVGRLAPTEKNALTRAPTIDKEA